jgi:hypothetical protein
VGVALFERLDRKRIGKENCPESSALLEHREGLEDEVKFCRM